MASWGQWMVPELSLSAEAQLEAAKRDLMREVKHRPDEVAALAGSLLQQNALLRSILSNATAQIAEHELKAALSEVPEAASAAVAALLAPPQP
mgnify:CR=1 FL=1